MKISPFKVAISGAYNSGTTKWVLEIAALLEKELGKESVDATNCDLLSRSFMDTETTPLGVDQTFSSTMYYCKTLLLQCVCRLERDLIIEQPKKEPADAQIVLYDHAWWDPIVHYEVNHRWSFDDDFGWPSAWKWYLKRRDDPPKISRRSLIDYICDTAEEKFKYSELLQYDLIIFNNIPNRDYRSLDHYRTHDRLKEASLNEANNTFRVLYKTTADKKFDLLKKTRIFINRNPFCSGQARREALQNIVNNEILTMLR